MVELRGKREIPQPGKRKSKYPFDTMEVGESFLYTDGFKKNTRLATQKISAMAIGWAKYNGSDRKFSCRKEAGGIGVYRVK